MFRVYTPSRVLLCLAGLASNVAFAQTNNGPDLSSSVPNAGTAATPGDETTNEIPIAAEERATTLRDINAEWRRQRDELSARKTREWREIQADWKRKLYEISEQDISAAEKAKKRAAIGEEKDKSLKASSASYQEERARIDLQREQNRTIAIAAQGEMLVDFAGNAEETNDTAVSKSGDSGEKFYADHCKRCHFFAMEDQPAVVSIWDAVNSFTEAEFIERLHSAPGPMKDIPAVKSASDRKLGNVYHYILTWDDEAPAQDDKVPDPVAPDEADAPPEPGRATVAGADLSGNVSIRPAPLPTELDEPGTRAEIREQQFGNAQISCNLSGDEFEARWIAPYRTRSGWIPPVQNAGEADNAWVLRLRVRLESPVDGEYPDVPRPGWCTWLEDSLGSAADKRREIVIYARTASPAFGHFQFTENGVEIHHEVSGSSAGDNAKKFAIDVARAVTGVFYSSGRLRRTDGHVHADVQMIDRRWGVDGEPAFIVVDR